MEWILASKSPRRKELLSQLLTGGFEIIPAVGEEVADGARSCAELVQALAAGKAREVASLPQSAGKAVLGSDTVVVLDGEVLGKPKDEADAKRMLLALSGRVHEVHTGVCISVPVGEQRQELIDSDCTRVEFERLTECAIDAYVATGSPMDKAGAYGIQDGGLVKRIDGSFTGVVGLPVELCEKMIQKAEEMAKK